MLSLIAGLMLACGAAAGDSLDGRIVALMTVNGQHPATVIVHLRPPDAWVPLEELRGAGLVWRDGETRQIDGLTYVSLQSLRPAVTFRLDLEDAALDVSAGAASFPPRHIDFDRRATPAIAPRTPNAFANYSATGGAGIRPRYQAEVGATLRGAVLQSSLAWANGSLTRGPASITVDNPRALLRFEAGEARLPGFGAAPAVGVLGVSLSRQLGWDPALLRYSPLHLSGETAVPADVDVYVNNQLVQRMRVDAGPFELRNLSPSAGGGVARIVVRDDYGRQQEISTSFYRSPRVLRRGLQEFAYGAGSARRETLARSAHYHGFGAAGQHRVGVTDGWTLGAYGRRSPSMTEAGLESAFRLPFGELAVLTSQRRSDAGTGAQGMVSVDSRRAAFSLGASLRAASVRFAQGNPSAFAAPTREMSVYAGTLLPYGANVTAGFSGARDLGGEAIQRTTVAAHRVWFQRVNVAVTGALATTRLGRHYETSASLAIPLGPRSSATAGYVTGSGAAVAVQQSLPAGPGFGYRAQLQAGGAPALMAGEWQGDHAVVRVEADRLNGRHSSRATMAGSLAVIDRRVHLGRPITDAFAVVDLPRGARLPVFLNNQYVGRTDGNGRLFVPGLASYDASELRIDSSASPLDLAIDADTFTVRPAVRGGALVRFATRELQAVTGRFLVQLGQRTIVPAFGEAYLPDTGERSPIGALGEFYFEQAPPGATPPTVEYLGERYACAALPAAGSSQGVPRDAGVVLCTAVRSALAGDELAGDGR